MLTEVCLRDFKNHVATTVKPGRMTCLVGPNGCGKTSVLEAIQLVSVSINSGAAAFTNRGRPLSDLIRKGASTLTVDAVLACDEAAEPWLRLSLSAEPEPEDPHDLFELENLAHLNWRTSCKKDRSWKTEDGHVGYGKRPAEGIARVYSYAWDRDDLPDPCNSLNLRSMLFLPQVDRLRTPSYSAEEVPELTPDGSSLPSVIAYLITTEPDLFATLMQRIRDVLPQVERLRTRPAKVALNEPAQVSTRGKEIHYLETREVIGHELLFDLKDAPGIPARAVSEGTLLVTALLTATVWNQGADLLLIDDLEKGLHPKAQRELVTALKRLQEVDPNLQVMFSTHSPYIVDELTAEQVWILVADDARGVVARRLRDHPRAADALQVLTTGEFLDAEGEDWVRDAPDAP